jgi:signal transduction protein with GAF and PtsI domain
MPPDSVRIRIGAIVTATENLDVDFLHEIGSRMAAADPLHEVLARVVDVASALVKCDSCFVYVLEDDELVLRASKNPHQEVIDRLKLHVGQGITGWVAEHRQAVAISQNASAISMSCPRTATKLSCRCRCSAAEESWV